jgi:hypothetical protein
MRTLRVSLVGMAVAALLAGLSSLAVAQEDAEGNTGVTMRVVEYSDGGDLRQVEATDPRLSGTWAVVENCRRNEAPYVLVCTGSVRVENEGGTWLGRSWLSTATTPPHHVGWTVLEGQDSYAGLTAYLVHDEEKMADDPDIDGVGTIFDFALPFPEVLAE